jgi:4-hydroxybenzoate polyprenyltransferase
MVSQRIISMVKQLKIFYAFLRLMRFSNLLIIALTQYFIRWFILKPLLAYSGFKVQLSPGQFAILVLSTTFLAAAGYIINDYFDRKTDLINRPGRVIVGRLITPRYAMAFHFVFTCIGVVLGAYLSYSIHKLGLSAIFLFSSVILWLYSTTYKRQLLVGNIIISALVGMVPMLTLLFEFPLLVHKYQLYILAAGNKFNILIFWVGSYSIFAFGVNFIREIVKDMEDFEGDYIFGRHTIPIAWGMKSARLIIAGLVLIAILPICYLLFFHLKDPISLVYIPLFIVIPLLTLGIGILIADTKIQYHRLSFLIKMVMLTGLLYCPLVYFIISSFKK